MSDEGSNLTTKGGRMAESAEGIGSRKWSLLREDDGVWLMQGAHRIARLEKMGEAVLLLLVTAPQLWDAANDVMKQTDGAGPSALEDSGLTVGARDYLGNMVAKAVGKQDWKDVAQA